MFMGIVNITYNVLYEYSQVEIGAPYILRFGIFRSLRPIGLKGLFCGSWEITSLGGSIIQGFGPFWPNFFGKATGAKF